MNYIIGSAVYLGPGHPLTPKPKVVKFAECRHLCHNPDTAPVFHVQVCCDMPGKQRETIGPLDAEIIGDE